jgi:hypothetical protein
MQLRNLAEWLCRFAIAEKRRPGRDVARWDRLGPCSRSRRSGHHHADTPMNYPKRYNRSPHPAELRLPPRRSSG